MSRSGVELGTIAALLLVTTHLIEELPVLFGEVLGKEGNFLAANGGVGLFEEEQQLHGVGLDEELSEELVLA